MDIVGVLRAHVIECLRQENERLRKILDIAATRLEQGDIETCVAEMLRKQLAESELWHEHLKKLAWVEGKENDTVRQTG